MDKRLKYLIYCRKSSEDEDKQILSIESQIRELTDYAKDHNLHIVDLPLFENKSAHKPGREVFTQIMERIESGEANAVLVWHVNRIARNSKDGGNFIWLMDQGKIQKVSTPSKEYLNTPDDKFYMNLEFSMAKKSSDDLSQVVKRGLRQKYERGEYPNYAPLGYLNMKVNGFNNIIPDPERAILVRKAFEEYSTGRFSLGQLVKQIALWGLKTRRDKPVNKAHLHSLLQKPIYYGYFNHGGSLHKGSYEPLISKEIFIKVQDVLHGKSKPKKISNDWAYAALLKCGCRCGSSVIFETKKKYYRKTDRFAEYTYARSSKRCGVCIEKGISLERLEDQIIEKLDAVTIDEETWKLGIKLLEAKYEKEANERAIVISNRQREFKRLDTELDGYFKMRAREEISADEFQRKKIEIHQQQNIIQEKIDDGIQNKRNWLELAVDFLNTAFRARDLLESELLEDRRKAVEKIGWNLELKSEKLVWTYQMPYDVLLIPEYRTDVRST